MATYTLKYDSAAVGMKATCIANGAQLCTSFHDRATVYNVKPGQSVVLTGDVYTDGKWIVYYLTTTGLYMIINFYDDDEKKWNFEANAYKINNYSKSQAQALVDKIINNNKIIIMNNLLCARYANKLSDSQKQAVKDLQNRLESRNTALLESGGIVTDVETSYPAGYAELAPYLTKLMNAESIGLAAWAIAVIVISCMVAISTAAYFTYKSLADESEHDVQYSKELTRTLTSKLTEEEYQQLLRETKGIVTKSKIKQLVRTYSSWLSYVAIGLGTFVIYRIIKNRQ